jgi:hypothetical protein|tara:strand:- start:5934 stop:6437 length:504 start_codon:yes stop_codon:yes gene_type:complete
MFFFLVLDFLFKKENDTFVSRYTNMIQRIQSIYLLLASIISGGLIFVFNLWSSPERPTFVIDLFKEDSFLLNGISLLFLLSATITFIAIFLFKKRQLQFVFGRISILINLLLLGLLIYVSLILPGEMKISEKGIGMFLPILAILFVVFANKAIQKDEDLVKSVDRLR